MVATPADRQTRFCAGAALRRAVFFGLDAAARDGAVRRHLRDLDALLADPARAADAGLPRLTALLRHAADTTRAYADRRGRHDRSALADLPVITKRDLTADPGAYASSAYAGRRLTTVTTSGSYGTPCTFLLTPEKAARRRAEVLHFGRWAGYELGRRHAYIRVTSTKGRLDCWLQNQLLLDPRRLDDAWLDGALDALRRRRVGVVIGYPSAMAALARRALERGWGPGAPLAVRSFVSVGESLTGHDRDLIEAAFGCRALSRYSAEELGVLAHECREERRHHLNTASYVVELLEPDSDGPVPPGETGRVVVTDLFSHAVPLIRYDTGDLAALSPEPCPCGRPTPVLAALQGRAVEAVRDAAGRPVSPFAINGALRDLGGEIRQFRFIQEEGQGRYTLEYLGAPGAATLALVRERLERLLGAGARLALARVEDIPALPSGKRPYIVSRPAAGTRRHDVESAAPSAIGRRRRGPVRAPIQAPLAD